MPVRKSVRKMAGYVPGEQSREPGITKLNTNENPYPPSPAVAEAILGLVPERLRLYPDPLATELRQKLASLHECPIDRVFVGNGSDEILALCTRAFVEDDGSIGFFDPSYSLYPVLARMRDVAARPVRLGANFGWRMPAGYEASLFFLANPNAPTGVMYDKDTVGEFCGRFAGVVVIDEAYADFAAGNCADLALRMNNVIAVRTMSKAYSLAGIRIGYALGPRQLIAALFKLKDSYNTDAVSQKIAAAALSDTDHMRRNVEKIRATRRRLSLALGERGFAVVPSEANFLLVKPPSMPAELLFRRLRERKIMVRHFAGTRVADFVRITIGTEEETDRLLDAVDAILRGTVPEERLT